MESDNPEPLPNQPVDTTEHQPMHIAPMYPGAQPKSKKYVFIMFAILVLSALGFAAFKLFGAKKAQAPAPPTAQQTPAPAATTNKNVPDVNSTELYENGFLGIKATYPKGWTATETENKDSVRLESPAFTYKTVSKGSVTGHFRIYIRKGAREIDGKYIGRGYAIQPSGKLAYAQPAVGQRTDTNLSLFGLDSPDNFAFFMIAGNYSLNKGDTLGPNYGKEAETYIIAGGYTSADLKDDLATNPVSPAVLQTSNAYKQALDILKSLQLR